uniref:Uncharacterized protein n=1 Tax=Trichogramma kaykai TaxID=54128 RepID=A0ABD2XNK9_9HYME
MRAHEEKRKNIQSILELCQNDRIRKHGTLVIVEACSYIERIVHAYREASLSHVARIALRCAAAAKKPRSEENFLEQQQQQKLFFLDSRLAGLVFQTFITKYCERGFFYHQNI